MNNLYQIIFLLFIAAGFVFGQSSAGNALSTDGSTQFAYPNAPNVAGYSEGTIEFWFTSDSWSSNEQLWTGGNGLPGTNGDWAMIGTHISVPGRNLAFGMYTNSWLWASSWMQPEDGRWYHLAATWGSAGMKLYIDGELKGQHSHTGAFHNYTTELISASAWGITFDGDIDEMRFWNYALDSTKIRNVYQDTLGPAYYTTLDSGLIAYYRMDMLEDLGANGDGADDIKDYSVNANHVDAEGISSLDTSGAFQIATSLPSSQKLPTVFELKQNYPNPFNPSTNIEYILSKGGFIKIEIFNTVGEKIQTLFSGIKSAGKHTIQFDASGLSSGIYIYQIETLGIKKSGKMVFMK